MTNYPRWLAAILAAASCAHAAGTARSTKPAPAKPVAAQAAPANSARTYTLAPQGGSLNFTFVQEGAATDAEFRQIAVTFVRDDRQPAAGSLDVKVQMASVFTGYEDRDKDIRGEDILDVKNFPVGEYHATAFAKTDKGVDALGKLTVHGVTRDLRIPLVIRPLAGDGSLIEVSGGATVNRLDYGVGKGDYASTDSIENPIKLAWRVKLAARK